MVKMKRNLIKVICGLVVLISVVYESNFVNGEPVISENLSAGEMPSEKVVFTPKVLVSGCEIFEEDGVTQISECTAGKNIILQVNIKNESSKEKVYNLSLNIREESECFWLMSPSDTIYIGDISAGESRQFRMSYHVCEDAKSGQYDFLVDMDYSDIRGNTYNSSGCAKVRVVQESVIIIDPVVLESDMEVGEVKTMSVHAMNVGRGKIYNLRAELSMECFPDINTIYVGNLEPGTDAGETVTAIVRGLTSGHSSYGITKGRMKFTYEDEFGKQCEELQELTVNVKSPFYDIDTNKKKEDKPEQWWNIMVVMLGISAVLIVIITVKFIYNRRQEMRKDELCK